MFVGILVLLIANFIGGALNPLFVKLAVQEIPPLTFTALRFLIATCIFAPFFLKEKKIKLTKKDISTIANRSIFFSLNVAFFSFAIQFTTVIMSQILYTFVPILVAIFAYFYLGEKITKNKIIGGCIAIFGLSFLLYQSMQKQEALTFGMPLGNILGMCAVISWSLYIVFSKKLTNTYTPVTTSFFSFFVTSILLLIIAPIELLFHPFVLSNVSSNGIFSLLGASIISSALMFFLIQVGLKKTSAITSSLFSYTAPFFATLSAIPVFHEKPTIELVIGGFLIIIGVFYATTYSYIKKKLLNNEELTE